MSLIFSRKHKAVKKKNEKYNTILKIDYFVIFRAHTNFIV